jgi:DNA-binding CsgD family transcriptional regulator
MSTSAMPSEGDLRTLAGMVSDHRADVPRDGLPLSLLAELMSQIRCQMVAFHGYDSERQQTLFLQHLPGGEDVVVEEDYNTLHWQHYWNCQPCSYPDRTGDLRSVVKVTDFYSARQWHSTGMYCDMLRPWGHEHELMLTLSAAPSPVRGPGRTVRLFFFREPGADFSERDRALLVLLRPHLHQAYLDAERRRHPVPELTARHWDLLRLIAAGHTNTQIARRLDISEATVRAHLENIYGRLNVSSRTAAVTQAFQTGLHSPA